jgi:hypothetical protein
MSIKMWLAPPGFLRAALEPISKPCLKATETFSQDKVESGSFKSSLEKGGFRRISGGYINPPCPPFSKGGNYFPSQVFWLIQYEAEMGFERLVVNHKNQDSGPGYARRGEAAR